MNGAWRIEMTEIEHGWGMRPDGFIYSLNKEALEQEKKRQESTHITGYSYSGGNVEFVPIDENLHKELMGKTIVHASGVAKHPGDLTKVKP